tara:strand:- start:1168 stop:2010 length:843 start_codon:yes stop_codon:yes gene_type:complete
MTDSTNGAAERLAETLASIASKASDTEEEKHVRRVTETEDSVIVEYEKEMEDSEEDDIEDEETTKELLQVCSSIKAEEGEEGTFYGYGSIFNNTDLGNDVVVNGAFTKSLARTGPKGVKLLYQHKSDMPIGVFEEIEEDGKGLKVKGRLALGTQAGREAYELLKMGALDGLSIGFRVSPKGQEYDGKSKKRFIKEVDLMEISLVTFPMNPKARVRSVKGEEVSIREWENGMRDAFTLSRSEAKVAAKAVHEAFNQRDADESKGDVAVSAINSLTNKLKHL